MSASYGPRAVVAVAMLGALAVLATGVVALTLGMKVPVDPREGWNAYNAAAATSGGQLYPGGLWFNNYPPLSYFAVAGMGAFLGDAIVAGRIIALVSTWVAAWLVALTASRLQCNRFESLFAGLLFLTSPWILSKYAQMDDPQMLGQALGCAGFAVLVWQPRGIVFIILGAFLLALALFVKPLFLVQPLVMLAWLAIDDRKSALSLAFIGTAFCLTGLILSNVLLKTDLAHDMLLARVYSPSRMFSHPGQWLVSGLVPLAATLCLFRYRRDRHAILCVVYVLIAIPVCLFVSGGEGVAGNATFDLSIGCALGAAVFVNRVKNSQAPPPSHSRSLSSGRASRGPVGEFDTSAASGGGNGAKRSNAFPPPFSGEVLSPAQAGRSGGGMRRSEFFGSSIIVACVLPLAFTFVIGMFGGWASGPSIFQRMKLVPTARSDVAFIEAHAGPAMCEQPALCYWAGKPAQIDVWGLSQAFARHTRPETPLTALLAARRFAVVEISPRSTLFHFAAIRASLLRNYKTDHADPLGIFLVPVTPGRR